MKPVFMDNFYRHGGDNWCRYRAKLSNGWMLSFNPKNTKLKATWNVTKRYGKTMHIGFIDELKDVVPVRGKISEESERQLAAICMSKYIEKVMDRESRGMWTPDSLVNDYDYR